MVEFGLKLEDNKVEDWKDRYIDYDKLKSLIQEAKVTVKLRVVLEAQNPKKANEIKTAFAIGAEDRSGCSSASSMSESNLMQLAEESETTKYPGENKVLLADHHSFTRRQSYGGSFGESIYGSASDTKLKVFIKRSMSSIFQRRSYKNKLKNALEDEGKVIDMFSECIHDEVRTKITQ